MRVIRLEGENMNKDMLVFLKGLAIVGILLLLSTPLILMNVFQGDLSGPWIGFWGSFAGGILGTAGVIYVAHLQNNTQKESLETIENHNRERLSIQTKLDMIQNFKIELNTFKNEVDKYKGSFETLVRVAALYETERVLVGSADKDTELKFLKHQNIFIPLGPKYFSDLFSIIETNSILLSHLKDVELEAFSIEDRKHFEKMDEIVKRIKQEDINTVIEALNIFNIPLYSRDSSSPFQLASGGLDYMNQELSIAQSRLIKRIDTDIEKK